MQCSVVWAGGPHPLPLGCWGQKGGQRVIQVSNFRAVLKLCPMKACHQGKNSPCTPHHPLHTCALYLSLHHPQACLLGSPWATTRARWGPEGTGGSTWRQNEGQQPFSETTSSATLPFSSSRGGAGTESSCLPPHRPTLSCCDAGSIQVRVST